MRATDREDVRGRLGADQDTSPQGNGKGAEMAAVVQTSAPMATGAGQPMIDLEFLRALIDAVDRSGIDTLELHRGGTRIRISKSPASGAAAAAGAPAVAPVAAGSTTTDSADVERAETARPSNLVEVRSPMVGTFYRAPAPEAPPYVEPGSTVVKGQTLCILEAMKLMNELPSEVDGIVREVLVENAEPVEYGQVLFLIEPTGSP